MTLTRRIFTGTLGATAVLLLTAGCMAESPAPSDSVLPANDGAPEATVEPTPTETVVYADPTCETIISPSILKSFTDIGWTAKEQPFIIGDVEVKGGLQCMWADYSVANDHVQIYGWSPITEDEKTRAEASLLSQGWVKDTGPNGDYVTESNPITVDDDGFGQTYLFGDGWVEVSDTKQGLALIKWPPTS